jgi:hypothetical protein
VSYFDISDAEGVELDGDRDDDECPFGDESTVVSEPDPWTLAAMSGEEESMSEEQDGEEMVMKWIDDARPAQLRRISYHIDNVIERRKTELAREAKELEQFDKPVRATRKDAGIKRAEYKAQKGAA